MAEWSNTNGNQNVSQLPLSSFYQESTYTDNTWSTTIWTFNPSELPILKPVTPSPLSWGGTGFSLVTYAQSRTASHYLDSSWTSPPWNFPDNELPTLVYPSGTFPNWGGSGFNTITKAQSMMKNTYLDSDWDMERVWVIREGIGLPRHVYRYGTEGNLGDPLEHAKRYIMVEPHIQGTMNWDGVTWKYIQTFYRNPNPPLKGEPGTRVTYAVTPIDENQLWYDPTVGREVPVTFIASAIRDPLGAGGFSKYTNEKVRSDILNNSYSTIINFYFARLSDLPKDNYKLKIQTPTGLIEANTRFSLDGPIIMSTNPDTYELVSIPYVDLSDEMATSVRVSTPDGIKALMKWQDEKDYNLKGTD